MRRLIAALLFLLTLPPGEVRGQGTQPAQGDLAAARAVFEKNLDAIRRRDKAAYLSSYWKSEKLARTGADGIALGYTPSGPITSYGPSRVPAAIVTSSPPRRKGHRAGARNCRRRPGRPA